MLSLMSRDVLSWVPHCYRPTLRHVSVVVAFFPHCLWCVKVSSSFYCLYIASVRYFSVQIMRSLIKRWYCVLGAKFCELFLYFEMDLKSNDWATYLPLISTRLSCIPQRLLCEIFSANGFFVLVLSFEKYFTIAKGKRYLVKSNTSLSVWYYLSEDIQHYQR